jgi:hypothetical protein
MENGKMENGKQQRKALRRPKLPRIFPFTIFHLPRLED